MVFLIMLVELINGKSVPRIRCLVSRDTKCPETFDDSTEIPNIILMFEHLKISHATLCEDYTKNIHKWSAQPKKVNNLFLYRKNLKC